MQVMGSSFEPSAICELKPWGWKMFAVDLLHDDVKNREQRPKEEKETPNLDCS